MINRHFAIFVILTIALPVSVFACSAGQRDEQPKLFDPKTEGDLVDPKTLTPIEKRLNDIIIPEIDFRCANIYDITDFYDDCVKKYGGNAEKEDKSRVRLACDKRGFGNDTPVLHFGSLKMPLLYALRMTCAIGDVKYRINGNTVTLYKPKKTGSSNPDSTSSNVDAPSVEKRMETL